MSGLEGLLAGRVLGDRYRIEEVIGRGGMGAVYRATDERLGRQVAVKVITVAGTGDAESRERLRARFYREARAAAALPHHPNVVPVYDYGSDPTLGLDYLVMELLRGNDLATRLARSGPPSLSAGLRILHEAARGVAVGHRSGLIHRDIKPGNIFLAEADHNEVQVRVVDFGIAKLADDEDTFNQLTQDGRVPHSPAFASPEQLRGLSQLTPASDVFSLGAVGYTLLTGERPFSEADRNRMSLGMPVPAPSPRARNPAIPTAVEAVLQRALAFDPQDRFPDAGAMAIALAAALRDIPDTPLEPYAAVPVAGADAPDDRTVAVADEDESTRAMEGEDDRTLLAPPAAPPAREPGPPGRAFPSRREPRRRRLGSILLWTLGLLALGAAVLFVIDAGGPEPGVEVDAEIPPPPDTMPIITPEIGGIDTAGQPGLDAVILNEEGKRLLEAGDLAGAAESFRAASELVPAEPSYAYNYALALLRAGDAAGAAEQLDRVTRLDPGRADAYYNLGRARLELGDTAAAWTALRTAADLARTPVERAAALREIRAIEAAQRVQPTDTLTRDTSLRTLPRDTAVPRPVGTPTRPRRDTAGIDTMTVRPR